MHTTHRSVFADAGDMRTVASASVDLVVTSPPYPMIAMWDAHFGRSDPQVAGALDTGDGPGAWERMHRTLDPVWGEVQRVLKPGGFACVNIGDATRTVAGRFALYPNHGRILARLQALGLTPLPCILWRKPTNAPNKFMGSGMLPAGAYVTLEHEYLLILRKGAKRNFATEEERRRRRASAIFWEERNAWYSDVWFDLRGTPQALNDEAAARRRSGAFPFELAYRLINMYSIKGDRVLDPFAGTGTTQAAAMASARDSIGYEIDAALRTDWCAAGADTVTAAAALIGERLARHRRFVEERRRSGAALRYVNRHYDFAVVTSQETDLWLDVPQRISRVGEDCYQVDYLTGVPAPL